MWEAQHEAAVWLYEVANVDRGLACLLDQAMGTANPVTYSVFSLVGTPGWV